MALISWVSLALVLHQSLPIAHALRAGTIVNQSTTKISLPDMFRWPNLKLVTKKGESVGKTKLKRCAGDCDSDDCANGLKCFQRSGLVVIPSCSTKDLGMKDVDYCYKPPKLDDSPGKDGKRWFGKKMTTCQGDCDSDSDCENGLKCFKVKRGVKAKVPGCEGEGTDGFDYCYSAAASKSSKRKKSRKGSH